MDITNAILRLIDYYKLKSWKIKTTRKKSRRQRGEQELEEEEEEKHRQFSQRSKVGIVEENITLINFFVMKCVCVYFILQSK